MLVGFDLAAIVAVFVAACAVADYRTKKIPNWLTVPAAGAGLIYHMLAPHGIGPLWAVVGFALGFGLLLLPWLLGGGGMGDVKLLAALGTWLGPTGILTAFGLSTMLAALGMIGVLVTATFSAGFWATRNRYAAAGASSGSATSAAPRKGRRVLPFAVPVALGTWLWLGWMLLKTHG